MKNILFGIITALAFAACNSGSSSDSETKKEIVADTTTNYSNSALSDTGSAVVPAATPEPVAKVEATEPKSDKTVHTSKVKHTETKAPVSSSSPATTTTTTTTSDNTSTSTQPVAAPVEEKKGWSNSAKGAVIGGGAGAIGGAIISKKKGKGAIIGGVLGAGAGYIIGRKKDKQDTLR